MIPSQVDLVRTGDGSASIRVVEWDEPYHSRRGAVNESMHVYIDAGIRYLMQQSEPGKLSVLEMGFGTGLVTFLSAIEASRAVDHDFDYTSLEVHPLAMEQVMALDYPNHIGRPELSSLFAAIHLSPWGSAAEVHERFRLTKLNTALQDYEAEHQVDLLLYDAFGPRVQPELWTPEHFAGLHRLIRPGGFLVTYCAKGVVKRALRTAGFEVETLPGPPGKREMIRAWCR
ncbi:MAG: tRNA (5-methylaminomethyl-2-thiouridine)(34)-methyltransferase MnmD [Bacteroidota bacterium]